MDYKIVTHAELRENPHLYETGMYFDGNKYVPLIIISGNAKPKPKPSSGGGGSSSGSSGGGNSSGGGYTPPPKDYSAEIAKAKADLEGEKSRLSDDLNYKKGIEKDVTSNNLRGMYIKVMKDLKAIPQSTASYGVGGESRKIKKSHEENYTGDRIDEEKAYSRNLEALQKSYNDKLASAERRYLDKMSRYQ